MSMSGYEKEYRSWGWAIAQLMVAAAAGYVIYLVLEPIINKMLDFSSILGGLL